MIRTASLSFITKDSTLTLGQPHANLLREAMLSEFIRVSFEISDSTAINDVLFLQRNTVLQILNRIDCHSRDLPVGRSRMCIDGMRLTVAETELIKAVLNSLIDIHGVSFGSLMQNVLMLSKISLPDIPLDKRVNYYSEILDHISKTTKK